MEVWGDNVWSLKANWVKVNGDFLNCLFSPNFYVSLKSFQSKKRFFNIEEIFIINFPTQRDREGKGSPACCRSWGCKESDWTEPLNWTELKLFWLHGSKSPSSSRIWSLTPRAALAEKLPAPCNQIAWSLRGAGACVRTRRLCCFPACAARLVLTLPAVTSGQETGSRRVASF